MNRFFYFYAVLLLICCGKSNTPIDVEETETFKDIATKELYSCIDRRLPHDAADKPEIWNVKEMIDTDSAYACAFEMKFKNKYNGWSHGGFTFVCVQLDGKKRICLIDRYDDSMLWAEIEGPCKNDYERAVNYCNCLFVGDYVEEIQ